VTKKKDRFMRAKEKYEEDLSEGFELLLGKWKKPVVKRLTIDKNVKIAFYRPNLRQLTALMSCLTKLGQPPEDPSKFEEHFTEVIEELAPILAELIDKPEQLSDEEFWLSMEYPLEFLVDVINIIMGAYTKGIETVQTFRQVSAGTEFTENMGEVQDIPEGTGEDEE